MTAWGFAAFLSVLGATCVGEQPQAGGEVIAVVGRALDPDGNPLAGAIVLADNGGSYQVIKEWTEIPWRNWVPDPVAAGSVGPYTRRAKSPTGDDGRFRVDDVPAPAGAGWVVVIHPEFATARIETKSDAKDGVLNVGDVTLRPGAAVRATVRTQDGKPAAGAWVAVRSSTRSSPDHAPSSWAAGDEPGDVRIGRTDDDGACIVRGLNPGRLRVAAFTPAHLPTVVEVDGAVEKVAEAAITMAPGATLRVEVASRGANTPVPGARVTVVDPEFGRGMPGPPPLAQVRTDQAGVAVIDGLEPIEEFRVIVVPPDFADDRINHPGAFHVSSTAKPGATLRVALTPPITLAVHVVDAQTKAQLEGAKIIMRADWKRFDHSGGQPIELAPKWDAEAKAYVTRSARPGPWIVKAWALGHLPSGETNVEVGLQDPPAAAVVALAQGTASATGRVVDKTAGTPIAGATVSAYEWVERMGDGNRAAAGSGEDGTFLLAPLLGAGFPLRLEVKARGYVRAVPEWPAGGRPAELGDVALQRGAAVEGRLTDAKGRPLARVGVSLQSFESRGRGKGDGRSATTDDDGRFTFDGLPPGNYVLDGQRESSPIRVAEGATVVRNLVR